MGYSLGIRSSAKTENIEKALKKVDFSGLHIRFCAVGKTAYCPGFCFGFDYNSLPYSSPVPVYRFMYELSKLCGDEGTFYYDYEKITESKTELDDSFLFGSENGRSELLERQRPIEDKFNQILKNILKEI